MSLVPHLRTFVCIGLATLAVGFITTARVFFIEQHHCRQLHSHPDGRLLSCADNPEVHAQLARTTGIYDGLALLPSLVLTAPYATLVPRFGKWSVLRLGASGQIAAAMYVLYVVSTGPWLGIEWIWLAPLFDVVGGGSTFFQSLAYSTLADTLSPDEDDRASLLFLVTAFDMLCGFLSFLIASQLLRYGAEPLMLLGIAAFALVILVTSISTSPPPGTKSEDDEREVSDDPVPHATEINTDRSEESNEDSALMEEANTNSPTQNLGQLEWDIGSSVRCASHCEPSISYHLGRSYVAFWQSIRGNAVMVYVIVVAFANRWALSIRVIFVPWAARTYTWAVADSAALSAAAFAVSSIVLLSLPWVQRKCLVRGLTTFPGQRAATLSIAKYSLALNALGVWVMGATSTAALYAVATCVYSIGVGFESNLQSFASCVATGHVRGSVDSTTVFLAIGMASSLGGVFGTTCWSQAFAWLTYIDEPGHRGPAIEFICCSLIFVATLGATWRLEALYGRTR